MGSQKRLVQVLGVGLVLYALASAKDSEPMPVASALGWFSRWVDDEEGSVGRATVQNCAGQYRNGKILLVCQPLNVEIKVLVGVHGECHIIGISRHIRSSDTFTFYKRDEAYGEKHRCDGIPQYEGEFTTTVAIAHGSFNEDLSQQARRGALEYLRHWTEPGCKALFPKVHGGDPAYHVYISCGGTLHSIEEFEISNGLPVGVSRGYVSFQRRRPSRRQVLRFKSPSIWWSSAPIGP